MIRPWQKIGSRTLGQFRVFTLREDRAISPRTGEAHDFYVLDTVSWVNVLALTTDDHLVMIEQYRHGTNTVELEIPGGLMDAEDADPIAAAVRELREETGYQGEGAREIGRIFPNPAIMNNVCHTILIERCVQNCPTQPDHAEDLLTRLVPVDQLSHLVAEGRIQHSLVVVALYYFDLLQRGLKRSL